MYLSSNETTFLSIDQYVNLQNLNEVQIRQSNTFFKLKTENPFTYLRSSKNNINLFGKSCFRMVNMVGLGSMLLCSDNILKLIDTNDLFHTMDLSKAINFNIKYKELKCTDVAFINFNYGIVCCQTSDIKMSSKIDMHLFIIDFEKRESIYYPFLTFSSLVEKLSLQRIKIVDYTHKSEKEKLPRMIKVIPYNKIHINKFVMIIIDFNHMKSSVFPI